MGIKIFLFILASVSLSAIAQITLKLGMSSKKIQQVLEGHSSHLDAFWVIASNGFVIIGLLMYCCGAILWLLVLAKLDVSLAYPFVGLGFILTMLLGFFILSEPIGATRILGTLLVVAGIILVSRI